jgi:hypothetical protein
VSKRKVAPKLASARAYWRLAAKARRHGQWADAQRYQDIGDRKHAQYLRDQQFLSRLKEQKGLQP